MVTRAWEIAATVADPEIPVLTIEDLGILRAVEEDGTTVRVRITPTYSGCPAMDAIRDDVTDVLRDSGYEDVRVELVLVPCLDHRLDEREGQVEAARLRHHSAERTRRCSAGRTRAGRARRQVPALRLARHP